MHIVRVTFTNGAVRDYPCRSFMEASDMCRTGISYSGGRIRRVEIDQTGCGGGVRAMWDASWDDHSKKQVKLP